MSALRYWIGIDVRRRGRSFVLAALALGLIGGAALGCLAAADRTATAHERLLAVTHVPDVAVEHGTPGSDTYVDGDLIAALPQVKRVGRGRPFLAAPVDDEGLLDPALSVGILSSDGHLYYDIARPQIVRGEMPDPTRADEALVNTAAAELLGVGLGDTFGIRIIAFDELPQLEQGDRGVGALVELRVSGIARSNRGEFYSMGADPAVITTPALARAHPDGLTYGLLLAELKRGDADVVAFTKGVEQVSGSGSAAVHRRADAITEFAHATRPYAAAWFAAAIALLVVVSATAVQILGRLTSCPEDDVAVSAMGMTTVQKRLAITLRGVLVAMVATCIAIGLAAMSSAFTLIGPASELDPDPGLRLNWVLLTGGAVVLFLVPVIAPFLRMSTRSNRRGVVADALA